ncbi:MAG: hypothetical protein ACT443_14250 [Gemmatimonadota bacterium]
MFNRNSLKLGLTGALFVMILGGFTACSDEGPTAPAPQYTDSATCWVENNQLVCN